MPFSYSRFPEKRLLRWLCTDGWIIIHRQLRERFSRNQWYHKDSKTGLKNEKLYLCLGFSSFGLCAGSQAHSGKRKKNFILSGRFRKGLHPPPRALSGHFCKLYASFSFTYLNTYVFETRNAWNGNDFERKKTLVPKDKYFEKILNNFQFLLHILMFQNILR